MKPSRIAPVYSRLSIRNPSKGGAQGLKQRARADTWGKAACGQCQDLCHAVPSQGLNASPGTWKHEKQGSCLSRDFTGRMSLLTLISEFWLPQL